jgi:hypothetical protein
MQNNTDIIEPLIERAEEYGKTTLELIKLKTLDKVANTMGVFVAKLLVALILFMFFAFANIGVALLLGNILGKTYYGFFAVATFYVIVLGIVYFFMNSWIKKTVANSIISQMLN